MRAGYHIFEIRLNESVNASDRYSFHSLIHSFTHSTNIFRLSKRAVGSDVPNFDPVPLSIRQIRRPPECLPAEFPGLRQFNGSPCRPLAITNHQIGLPQWQGPFQVSNDFISTRLARVNQDFTGRDEEIS